MAFKKTSNQGNLIKTICIRALNAAMLMACSTLFASEDDMDELDIDFLGEIELTPEASAKPWFRGFIDTRWGKRSDPTPHFSDQRTLAETRIQGHANWQWQDFQFNIKGDIYHDDIIDTTELDWREVYFELPDNPNYSLRIGRQNIVWGFGDLLVVNDLFPKDYAGLYFGRDAEAEYMVQASDGVRSSIFFEDFTWDIIAVKFRPNDIPTGKRLSFFSPFQQKIVGQQHPLNIRESDDWSLMTRLNTKLMGKEFAIFYTDTKSLMPDSYDLDSQMNYFADLRTFGLNIRDELGSGIWAYDAAYFDLDDESGNDPFMPNDSYRHILAYDIELASERSLGLQWYYEKRMDQSAYLTTATDTMDRSSDYSLMTMRLTQMLLSQNMTLSLYIFHSISQKDTYYRANLFHKFDDHWMLNIGINQITGPQQARFGQLSDNSNYFAAIRWSF
jgi:hypothetical protein